MRAIDTLATDSTSESNVSVYPRSFTIRTALLIAFRYFIHNSSHISYSNAQTLAGDKQTGRSPGCGRQNVTACLTSVSPTSSQLQKRLTYRKQGPIRLVDVYKI